MQWTRAEQEMCTFGLHVADIAPPEQWVFRTILSLVKEIRCEMGSDTSWGSETWKL